MATENDEAKDAPKPTCGIIMPISAIDGCTAEHWSEVKSILLDVIEGIGFEGSLVSDEDDVGIIHKRIIQNIYNNEIVICDVSGKNANVMFELGMRLAFDKPTIIIKDTSTTYSFDTSVIEHLEYPRDLRFSSILAFKEKLKKKITFTHDKAQADPNFSTFLKSFGEFKIAQIDSKEVSSNEFMLKSFEDLSNEMKMLRRDVINQFKSDSVFLGIDANDRTALKRRSVKHIGITVVFYSASDASKASAIAAQFQAVKGVKVVSATVLKTKLEIMFNTPMSEGVFDELIDFIRTYAIAVRGYSFVDENSETQMKAK